jgi:hypothetical protein
MFGWVTWTEYNSPVLGAALAAFGAAVAIGGVRYIDLDEIVSRIRQISDSLQEVRGEAQDTPSN